MYIFQKSFLRAKDSKLGYRNVNVSLMTMATILEDYVDGYLTLTHTHLRGTFYVTIQNLRAVQIPMVTTMTFDAWLRYTHDMELPHTTVEPKYAINEVLYSDAIQANFDIARIGRYLSRDANISNADRVDLHLTKNIPDKNHLYKRMLVSVNGFVHRTFPHEHGVSVAGAGSTFNSTGINTVGILSFYKCCDLVQHAITEPMITPTSATIPLYEELLINLGVPLIDKTVILNIGGYLLLNKDVGEIVNAESGIIKVKLKKLDLLKMILNSVGKIDLDPIGVFSDNRVRTYNKVRVNDIYSDTCIKKYMTLEQSFVIVADAECLQVDTHDLGVTGLPAVYEVSKEPRWPVMNSRGLLNEYWKSRNEDIWSVRLNDDVTKRYMYETNIDVDNDIINGMSPTYKWYHDHPQFLQIKVISKL